MRTRLPILLLALLIPVSHAQDAPDEPTILKLQTRIVGVSAVVRDKKGQPIRDLTRADFVLKQDGVPQSIRYFSQGSDLPLTLALLVDTSGSQTGYLDDEANASRVFFPAMLTRPEDRALVVRFDSQVHTLQRLTSSVPDLETGLTHLADLEPRPSTSYGGTLLYDSIYATAHAVLGKQEGRRAMVLLTDGGDNGSRKSIAEAVGEAQRSDIVIYSVYYGARRQQDWGTRVLRTLSDQTGGRVFIVDKKNTLEQIYAQIAEDMRLQYQLGYTPPESPVGSYHLIDLQPTAKHLTIEARKGYYTTRDKAVSESTAPPPSSNQ